MAKKKGMILNELILYLFIGSLLFAGSLKLFQISWLTFQTTRRMNDISMDFMHVSERIKFDLLGDIESLTIGENHFIFYFLQQNDQKSTHELKEYIVMMQGSRLVYNIYHGTGYTANYLSSMVRSISLEVEGDLMAIDFDYGDHTFRRYYRIDHIPTKRFLYSFHHPSDDLPGRHIRRARTGHGSELVIQLHILL